MLQCFVCSPIPKVSEKNGQRQSFIRKEITTARIVTLVASVTTSTYKTLTATLEI